MKINKESLPIFRHDLGKFTHFGTIYGTTAQLAIAHPCRTEYNSGTKTRTNVLTVGGERTMKRREQNDISCNDNRKDGNTSARQAMIGAIFDALPKLSDEHVELIHRFAISLRDGRGRPR